MKIMLNNILLFTLFIIILIFLLYNWILIQFWISKKQLFSYKITSKLRIFSFLLLFFITLCYVLVRIKLRFSNNGFRYNIYELYYIVQDYINIAYNEYTLSYNTAYLLLYPLLIVILGLSIGLFCILLVANVVKILRLAIIAVYVYLLQFPKFDNVNYLVFKFIIATRMFIFTNFESYPEDLQCYLDNIWRTLPIKIEYGIYRSLPIFLLYLDILLNNATLIIFFYIMPWYYIYSITRNLIILIKKLILDADLQALSLDMYKIRSKKLI